MGEPDESYELDDIESITGDNPENPQVEKLKRDIADLERDKKDMEIAEDYFNGSECTQLFQKCYVPNPDIDSKERDKAFDTILTNISKGAFFLLLFY